MASADQDKSNPSLSPDAAAEMARHGITRVPVDYFHSGEFRYTTLKDAVAQAKRRKCSDRSEGA